MQKREIERNLIEHDRNGKSNKKYCQNGPKNVTIC